jgi:hypothetical protein
MRAMAGGHVPLWLILSWQGRSSGVGPECPRLPDHGVASVVGRRTWNRVGSASTAMSPWWRATTTR